ncbi:MAG TPA: hypothetical protein VM681_02680 [Candidatus Thermoplasmatota archaeon]|nr:hypothetical protein [Candidatus Thermoplasmatota archaeon]
MRISDAKKFTPLGIIALFVSLAEGATVAAATQTTGFVQIAFAIFASTFPFAVLAGFYRTLWVRPQALYAPTDYGGMDPAQFASALSPNELDKNHTYQQVADTVKAELASPELAREIARATSQAGAVDPRMISSILESRVEETMQKVRKNAFLTIDSRPFLGEEEGRVWEVPYDGFQNPGHLLSSIWQTIGRLPRGNYARTWVLQDAESGRRFTNMGSRWRRANGVEQDDRSLEEIGILPGMTIRVVRMDPAEVLHEDLRRGRNLLRRAEQRMMAEAE